jgi:hypothetical protein
MRLAGKSRSRRPRTVIMCPCCGHRFAVAPSRSGIVAKPPTLPEDAYAGVVRDMRAGLTLAACAARVGLERATLRYRMRVRGLPTARAARV